MLTRRGLTTVVSGMLGVALVTSGCATTLTSAEFPNNTLTVIGTGRVALAPDTALVTLGAHARGTTLAEVTGEVSRKMSAVLAAIKSRGVADADIVTSAYSVEPRVSIARPEEPARVAGYQATNTVQVTVRQIADASAVVDAAIGAGANVVREIQFTRADTAKAQADARAAAVSDAMTKVRQLAAAAGVQLAEGLSIRESPGGRPIMRGSGMGPMGGAPPVEPGQLEVVVSVELRHAVRP